MEAGKYISQGQNDLSLPQRIMRFVSDKAELKKVGQGNITVLCNKLWDMSEEEFENTFGVIIK